MGRAGNIAMSVVLLIGATALTSCMIGDRVQGTGPVITRMLATGSFHGIRSDGSFDVMIKRGNARTASVEAQANIGELLSAEVRNGILHLSAKGNYTTDKAFIVHVTVPVIDRIELNGSGDMLSTDGFAADPFSVEVKGSGRVVMGIHSGEVKASLNGSGSIELTGMCSALDAHVKGSGEIKAGDLIAADATTRITGSGDITVRTTGHLEVSITGSGDVRYAGTPAAISRNITGSGEVKASKE